MTTSNRITASDSNHRCPPVDETFDPWNMLCTGFMFLRSTPTMISFMDSWRRELEAARGRQVNQYIFNDLYKQCVWGKIGWRMVL